MCNKLKSLLSSFIARSLLKVETSGIKREMLDSIDNFMVKYGKEYGNDIAPVAYIFSESKKMLLSESENNLEKILKENKTTAEAGALNILQNHAMLEIKYTTLQDAVKGNCDSGPSDLYSAINKEKYKKGFITKQQYDEAEELAYKLQFIPHHMIL
jgi:hypothetical protein